MFKNLNLANYEISHSRTMIYILFGSEAFGGKFEHSLPYQHEIMIFIVLQSLLQHAIGLPTAKIGIISVCLNHGHML